MRSFARGAALASALCFSLALAACGGGGGGSTTAMLPPAAPPASGGGHAAAVSYSPHATVYPQNYTQFWQCSGFPCGQPAVTIPFGSLAVNATGTTFYFFDENYGTVKLDKGTWSAYVSHTFNDNGTNINTGSAWGYSDTFTLFNVGAPVTTSTPAPGYLISNADSASGQTFTQVYANGFDLEPAALPAGRMLYAAETSGLQVIDNAGSSSAAVHTVTLPGASNCGFRVIGGENGDIDVSVCETFNGILRYSKTMQLLASATVADAAHINEVAPDPDGGVWFADDVGNHFGKMSASGQVTEFPVPANMHVTAVATGSDGSIWIALAPSTGNQGFLGHVSEDGTITTFALPQGLGQAEYLRGTFGDPASCTPNRLYWLDGDGSIGVIDLNPT